jgi:arylsulfatase A-like enzyme
MVTAAPGDDPQWTEVRIELGKHAGEAGKVVISVTPVGAERAPFSLAEPVIYRPAKPSGNVVIILIDDLRGDRVGFGGYKRPTSPNLDALAAGGFVFTRAYSPASWTRPSTGTLFTGLSPVQHGMNSITAKIPPGTLTLATRLRQVGFTTAGFTQQANVLPVYGYDQGIDRFVDVGSHDPTRNWTVVDLIDAAIEELERVGDRRFFFYIHVNQVHAVWDSPASDVLAVTGGESYPTELYDGEIHFSDREIQRFWQRLIDKGLDASTLLVVTADHGEEFGEHGQGGHGNALYEESLHIPLLFRLPGTVPAGRSDRIVGLADVNKTVLDLLRIPSQDASGNNLLADSASDEPLHFYGVVEDTHRLHAARDEDWKYILKLRPWGSEELYDLKKDPKEQSNRIRENKSEADRLARALHSYLGSAYPGFRLRIAGDTVVAHQVDLKLTTDGRFTRVSEDGIGPVDAVQVSADQRQIAVKVLASFVRYPRGAFNRERPDSVPVSGPDVTELAIVVEPPDSEVRIEMIKRQPEKVPLLVRLGTRSAEMPLKFKASSDSLQVRALPGEDFPKGGLSISAYVPRGTPLTAGDAAKPASRLEELPADVKERLRALGYDPD